MVIENLIHTFVTLIKHILVSILLFNIFRLSQSKQNKVYFPEEPFPHAQLVKSGRLKHFKHVYTDDLWNDLRQVNKIVIFYF